MAVLARYVSLPTAHSIIKLARARTGTTERRLDHGQLRAMLDPIERNLRLFLSDVRKAEACRKELDTVVRERRDAVALRPVLVAVHVEEDIVRARAEARTLAASMGFTPTGQTRLVTAVSELARNIVQYAGEGQIQITPTAAPSIEVIARDRGPGISNLAQIFDGTYKSKLGMGMGLRGVKRLADQFDVQTAAGRGTTVSFQLAVM